MLSRESAAVSLVVYMFHMFRMMDFALIYIGHVLLSDELLQIR
jgi:hypothetical protein